MAYCKLLMIFIFIVGCNNQKVINSQISIPLTKISPEQPQGISEQVLVVRILSENVSVDQIDIKLSPSVSGRSNSFVWSGQTDINGIARIDVNYPMTGYFYATAQKGDLLNTWHSITFQNNVQDTLFLEIGGLSYRRTDIIGQFLFAPKQLQVNGVNYEAYATIYYNTMPCIEPCRRDGLVASVYITPKQLNYWPGDIRVERIWVKHKNQIWDSQAESRHESTGLVRHGPPWPIGARIDATILVKDKHNNSYYLKCLEYPNIPIKFIQEAS